MTLTLATARATVRDHLDDDGAEGEVRWSDAQIDRALSLALSMCVDDYAAGGGDRFDLVTTVTTTIAGSVDLSALAINSIRGVALIEGQRYWPISQVSLEERNIDDLVIRDLQVRYTRAYTLPTNSAHPLVGVGATAAPSWDGFDHWVCARAAVFASTKDAEARPELRSLAQDMAATVMTLIKIPGSMRFPGPARLYSAYLEWAWTQGSQTLQMTRRT